METKFKSAQKILVGILFLSMLFWCYAVYGLLSWTTLLVLIIVASVIWSNKRHPADEMSWQLHLLASYCALMITMSLMFIFAGASYLKSSIENPLFNYVVGILGLSQALVSLTLSKSWNKKLTDLNG